MNYPLRLEPEHSTGNKKARQGQTSRAEHMNLTHNNNP